MSDAEATDTKWKARARKFGDWAMAHPGVVIPVIAFFAGMATPMFVRWLFS